MKVIHLNLTDMSGGAARAAYRIHQSLRDIGVDSRMWVNKATSGDWTVESPSSQIEKFLALVRPFAIKPLINSLKTVNPILHSPSIFPSQWVKRINDNDADLVHLHWVQGEMLSVSDIGQIRKPVVWTLHDMWAFCGAEHLSWDDRWRDGYYQHLRPAHEHGFDLNRWTWERKHKYWRRPFQIACPSHWLAKCVLSSSLMHDWPVDVVPNPIDTNSWKPIDKRLSRQLMSLPEDDPLLLFGAFGGVTEHHKGFDLLLAALAELRDKTILDNLKIVVFGQRAPESSIQLEFPLIYAGHLHDDLSLRILYSACDALVIPSRQDNFPNTGIEAHACGTPVVAFKTCGLTDIVVDRVTGALADPFEPKSLALAILWVLEDPHRLRQLCLAARCRAEQLWNSNRVASIYSDIYEDVLLGYDS